MKIQTISFVIGGKACNASCPFCVSRLTGFGNLTSKVDAPDWRNIKQTLKFAEASGVTTALLTGKGEPLLYPDHIKECLEQLDNSNIAFKEIQTNGILIQNDKNTGLGYFPYLPIFYSLGLRTVALSVVHWEDERNAEIYTPGKQYPSLVKTISILHSLGFTVRLSCIMVKGYVDNVSSALGLIKFCKDNDVEQLTMREVTAPETSADLTAREYVNSHCISQTSMEEIADEFWSSGTKLLQLPHGASVYDFKGQNVCISTCLTESTNPEDIRQIIYFLSDGSLRYSWQYNGARLL